MAEKETAQAGRLLRVLGLTFGIAIGVGTMIGGGILRTPGSVADRLVEPWLILLFWLLAGLHALLGANVVAEISTAVPKAGGLYVPTRRAFGDFAGLLVGWTDWLVNAAAAAALALVFADFAALIQPSWSPYASQIAAAVLLVLVGLNWLGVREGSFVQKAGSLAKFLLLLAGVATIFVLVPAAPDRGAGVTGGAAITLAGAIVAYQLIYGVFSGWPAPVFFVEEDENALLNIPRAMMLSIAAVTFVYLLINAVLLYALPIDSLRSADLPLATAMHAIFGGASGHLVAMVALVIVASCLNGVVMVLPRILYGLGRDGLFIASATRVNAGGTPDLALGISAALAVGLVLTGTFESVFLLMGALVVFAMIISEASLFALRINEPALARPYRAKGYPLLPILLMLIDVSLLGAVVWADPASGGYMALLIVLSVPIHLWLQRQKTKAALA
ncbi:MAG TPA: APC family permease [Sphingomicrobium sp.]|nr:APC family permease [Sphingomicrobium sp.]